MWVAEVKLNGEKGRIGSKTKKFNISISGYPTSFYETKKGIYVYMVGLIFGEEKNKKLFIKSFKKEKGVLHFENKGNFMITQIIEPLNLKPMYNKKIIHLKPVIIDKEGYNYWKIGSWNKKELMKFINLIEKKYKGELLKINQEKIKDFSILSIQPELTLKQKQALELAMKNNYYNYPREIELEKLAKLMKISYSTYQAHLRKAEKKILPFSFNH